MKDKIFIILGPTSSGKTFLAVNLCKNLNGEIISVDSRQIYKHMDIGTGKIPLSFSKNTDCWEIRGVTIWGYDLVELGNYFSAYDYSLFALNKIHDLLQKGKRVFLVGGTGLYIDVLTKRIPVSNIKPDFTLRKELEAFTLYELTEKLKSLNKSILKKIDVKNKIRLIRAIEKESNKKTDKKLPYLNNVDYIFIGLMAGREYLYNRADIWVDSIWTNGLIDEVKTLVSKGYKDAPQLKGLVYKATVNFLENAISRVEAIQKIKFDLHAYIRRQQTWFKKNKEVIWFDISKKDFDVDIKNLVESKLRNV